MAERLQLTLTYKNGNTIKNLVNYVHCENGKLMFTVDKQGHSLFMDQVKIPLKNISSYDISIVMCEGWKVVK